MPKVIRYYEVDRHGKGRWRPKGSARALGFQDIACGEDGPTAWAVAEEWNKRLDLARAGQPASARIPDVRSTGRLQPNTFVYFIIVGETVKVGFSKDPVKRLSELRTGIASEVTALVCVPADQSLERRLHKDLASERLNGEWFRLSQKAKEVINAAMGGAYLDGEVVL